MKTVRGALSQVDVSTHQDESLGATSRRREVGAAVESADDVPCRGHGPQIRCGDKEERSGKTSS